MQGLLGLLTTAERQILWVGTGQEGKTERRLPRCGWRSKVSDGGGSLSWGLRDEKELVRWRAQHEGRGVFGGHGATNSTSWKRRVFGKLQGTCCGWNTGANGRKVREEGGRQRGLVHKTAFGAKRGSWFLICRPERATEWYAGVRRHNQTFISKRQL